MSELLYDVVINNGEIISFEKNCILKEHNIGISNGIIKKISSKILRGKKMIDAKGKMVSPGFIDFHSHVDGKLYSGQVLLRQGATTTIGGERNFEGGIIRKISEEGFIINHGFYISHSFTLRKAVGLQDAYQAATNKQIDEMIALAEQFFQNGVFGIHFGLEFVPGTSENEIRELAKLSKFYNRIVLIHLRKDGPEAVAYFDEVLDIVKNTGASIHIQHLMYMAGFKGVMEKMIERLRAARKNGYDITADTGVYEAFPTCIGSSILEGDWMKKYGQGTTTSNLIVSSGIYAGQCCNNEKFKYLREEFPNTLVTAFVLDKEEIEKALAESYIFVSTNAADGPHYENIGHPETAGTFPKLIKKYVKETNKLGIMEAIGKISYEPAKRFGITGRGDIRENFAADIVIFNYDKISDKANYIHLGDPNASPEGIEYVLVNGEVLLEKSVMCINNNAGKMLEYELGY